MYGVCLESIKPFPFGFLHSFNDIFTLRKAPRHWMKRVFPSRSKQELNRLFYFFSLWSQTWTKCCWNGLQTASRYLAMTRKCCTDNSLKINRKIVQDTSMNTIEVLPRAAYSYTSAETLAEKVGTCWLSIIILLSGKGKEKKLNKRVELNCTLWLMQRFPVVFWQYLYLYKFVTLHVTGIQSKHSTAYLAWRMFATHI